MADTRQFLDLVEVYETVVVLADFARFCSEARHSRNRSEGHSQTAAAPVTTTRLPLPE